MSARDSEIRLQCVRWMTDRTLADNALPASPDDVMFLLDELAALRVELQAARDRIAELEAGDASGVMAESAPSSGSTARRELKLDCGCVAELTIGKWHVCESSFLCPERHNLGDIFIAHPQPERAQ